MAKDDYNYIVYKILLYFYGILKRKYSFDQAVFDKTIGTTDIDEGYLTDIFKFMSEDGLISGIVFAHAWGNEYVIVTSLERVKITPKGIQYLSDNAKMKQITEKLKDGAGLITELVKIVIP